MPKPKSYRVITDDGGYAFISPKRAQQAIQANAAREIRPGVIERIQREASLAIHHFRPSWGPQVEAIPEHPGDSRLSTPFLRYPQPSGGNTLAQRFTGIMNFR